MNKIEPDIMAKVFLYLTENGGREGPTPDNRLACPMVIQNEMFDCWLLLDGIGSIAPGDTVVVPIIFTMPEIVLDILNPGDKFQLWEGRIVGEGVVLEKCGQEKKSDKQKD